MGEKSELSTTVNRCTPYARAWQMGILAKRSLANAAWKSRQSTTDSCEQTYWKCLVALDYDVLHGDPETIASTALRFTLSVPEIDVVLGGSTNPDHFRHNTALLAAGPLLESQYSQRPHSLILYFLLGMCYDALQQIRREYSHHPVKMISSNAGDD